ncbi:carbohydate-binding domain-containing protein [Pseudoalteromonas tunicata]|uniref:family 20 glycosylhydrolase n=1 Tax=Pseudoalteromonas tunicata TaxID=314281 RepID=UPI00273E2142|nr:family 20 glycosylhydrolase [Pseudoalteromonas tunicata]MDP5213538.1 carbohydate-binding domain-containing protein [Pseudoalteromonas tunicata]
MHFKKSIIASLFVSAPLFAQGQLSQQALQEFTQNTQFQFAVVDNFHNKDGGFIGQISLANGSNVALPKGESDWQIYIHSIRKITRVDNPGLKIEHVNGDLHRIVPNKQFAGLAKGATLRFNYEAGAYIVSYTDFMPRAFMVSGNKTEVFANTDTEDMKAFVAPFERENQLKKFDQPKDLSVIADAANRYQANLVNKKYTVSQEAALKRIIPMPQQVDFNRGEVTLDNNWQIRFAGRLTAEVAVFVEDLTKNHQLALTAQPDHIAVNNHPVIDIKVDAKVNKGKSESYRLNLDKDKITIIGSDNAGAFYGLQSLLALIPADASSSVTLPRVEIQDSPRYDWRGMHYDNARNYHGKDAMFKLVEQMARYKLNKLHWHFSEDEGWRLEISGLPELTEIGAYRCFDLAENECLLTQLGTGPHKSGSGNGYLTRAEFVELLKFAAARHVNIIPEIEGPGHARASIKAMEARYRKLLKQEKELRVGSIKATATDAEGGVLQSSAATAYLLSDPADTSIYETVQLYKDNSVNVCLDSSYQFFDKVTYELQQMYREAGVRLTNLHFGGDEVGAGSWTGSPACQAIFADPNNGVSGVADLKPYFTQRIAKMLYKRGIAPGAWEDGLMYDRTNPFNRDEMPNPVFTANVWDNIWEWGVADRAYRLANAGYQVVMSHGTHLYFDHPYEAHPEERGYYWATRATNTEKAFGYMPDDVYANADFTRTGEKIENLEALVGRPMPKLEKPENILGIQGQVWSETIRTEDQVLAMIFPRLLSVAERAWHKADWEGQKPDSIARSKDFAEFSAALAVKELTKMAKGGVKPNLPVPGGVIEQGKLKANAAFDYLAIEYSLDNGASWNLYTAPISVKEQQKVALRSRLNDEVVSRITFVN